MRKKTKESQSKDSDGDVTTSLPAELNNDGDSEACPPPLKSPVKSLEAVMALKTREASANEGEDEATTINETLLEDVLQTSTADTTEENEHTITMPPKHTITCMGVSHGNFHTIYFGPNYDFPTDYPWGNHSERIMDPTRKSLGCFKPTWSVAIVPTSGEKVTGIFNIRDCSVSFAVDSMDQILMRASGQRICIIHLY